MRTNTAVIFIHTIEEQEQLDDLFKAMESGLKHLHYIGAGLSILSKVPINLRYPAERMLCDYYRDSKRGDKTSILLGDDEIVVADGKSVMLEVHRDVILTTVPTEPEVQNP